eukprot:TRINITY_DN63358_c0_g1_i1.p1 TRINITY_DN63358_c0_g1~~TRINITY_DN63358_c0_g1_i1.p1  ORF type:complete len:150 (-),score=12.36 TRINITY_DN63358_c0_g1_i1:53-502(-)
MVRGCVGFVLIIFIVVGRKFCKGIMQDSEQAKANPDSVRLPFVLPTSSIFYVVNKHMAIICRDSHKSYKDCKKQGNEQCSESGKEVVDCMVDVIQDLRDKCKKEFQEYADCMDYFDNNFVKCAREQKAFEKICPPLHPDTQPPPKFFSS